MPERWGRQARRLPTKSSENSETSYVVVGALSSGEEREPDGTLVQPPQKPMRVILVQTADGLKPPSGGFRGNYALLHSLAVHGHHPAQLCWAYPEEITTALAEIGDDGKDPKLTVAEVKLKNRDGEDMEVKQWKFQNRHGVWCIALDASVMIKCLPNEIQMEDATSYIMTGKAPDRIIPYIEYMKRNIEEYEPTHVVFNDALSCKVASTLPRSFKRAKRVQIVHTFEQLPLGPFAGGVPGSATVAEELYLWQDLDGIITVSKSLQKYAKEHNKLETTMIANHPWVYKDKEDSQLPRRRFNFSKQKVVMINPAEVKGYSVLREMVKYSKLINKNFEFVVYKGWGTTDEMVHTLEGSGVKVHDRTTDMEPVYDETTVLIMPSLWQEAWGIVATEAQLRGIVVMSSDVGGIREAKRYIHPIIPVTPIDGTKRNENGQYVIPCQDARPWVDELEKLLTDKDYYEETANAAYFTTRNWVKTFDERQHEKYLLEVLKTPSGIIKY